ncbi:amino acid ABC transporter substrate-binding protein [Rhodomicrobium sp. Az07]|uniref:amino acid ABC transporter substrate-binding protein n=1 Tax=Rhodomicrobium sp. Az07 TaxID=2839034 RepID=UPI001BE54E51|nr:amino acid ABC transporter substrate-binding protein [Rhodomicrobium sp. Az07]MBT3070320.1 amino acid ABC transporter substrate-binding protein [Rhodomicrobium sp. Az07]
MKRQGILYCALALLFFCAGARAGTLDEVKARGKLNCGVTQGLAGFSSTDASGNWAGLDVDFCRAVAAAIFDDPSKVNFVPLSSKQRFTALQSGEIDVLSRVSTWTMQNDTALGVNFVGVIYHDGQGLMVRKKLEVQSALELSGAEVCTNTGTTTELNIADFFRSRSMPYKIVAFEKSDEALKAYEAERCDVYSTDASSLSAQRVKLAQSEDHVILPDLISKEPLAPAVRQNDPQWESLVRWTLFALINAEELAVTKANADKLSRADAAPGVRRLLGAEGDYGRAIGLDNDWALKAIRAVGNYGEIFDRNLGQQSPLKIDRGLNRLWNNGGILFAPPVR